MRKNGQPKRDYDVRKSKEEALKIYLKALKNGNKQIKDE